MISAKIICDSINPTGIRLTTMEIEYPRFILSELNTHRMLSRNSASSRAIPSSTLRQHVIDNPATPVFWGENQPGMQAKAQVKEVIRAIALWHAAKESNAYYHQAMESMGLHKQITNRVIEPWMTMKSVISATEWANFFYLRDHSDAQPEIKELATQMHAQYKFSTPMLIYPGEWHTPYVERSRERNILLYKNNDEVISEEVAIKISASCCAQVSYRRNDTSIDKALKIYDTLINSKPAHASPVEHQATPISEAAYIDPATDSWPNGISHMTKDGMLWSGNFKDWIQYRKTLPGEAVW